LKITEEVIPHIEKALGIKLYEHQVNYLLDKGPVQSGRRTGKTLAYCVKLALSDGEPIDLKNLEKFSDFGDGSIRYARGLFKNCFMEIREKLKDYGLPVREVKF